MHVHNALTGEDPAESGREVGFTEGVLAGTIQSEVCFSSYITLSGQRIEPSCLETFN